MLAKPTKTYITAHSGCEGTPDNSMEHVRAAVASGAEILEIDVRSRDGVLYLWHDEKADPFGDGCVLFSDFLDELKKTPAVRVNCDMKTDGLAAAVMEEAAKRDMKEQILFTGSCIGEEKIINELGGEFWHGIWEPEEFEPALAACLENGTKVMNLPCKFVDAERKARFDALGLGFSCWTANSEAELRRLLELGIYNITTRKPVLALKLRKEIQGG